MSSIVRATVIALATTVLSSVAQAQGQSCTKLGYVNPGALMEAAPGRAAAESLLSKEGQSYQSQLHKM